MDSQRDKALGKFGEELAVIWYLERGYRILHRNWRSGRFEIDLITTRQEVLHFVEVKTRTIGALARPEDSVGKAKKKQLQYGAEAYLFQHPEWKIIQFDVIAIEMEPNGNHSIIRFEDIM